MTDLHPAAFEAALDALVARKISVRGTHNADLARVAITAYVEYPTVPVAYREEFHCFVPNSPEADPDDHEHAFDVDCEWGFICNRYECNRRVDDEPCPEHAPVGVAGLRSVECSSWPVHYGFVYDRDDYGVGCPWCVIAGLHHTIAGLHCQHGMWRRWLITKWVMKAGHWLGLSGSVARCYGPGCNGRCLVVSRWS